ncbi:MAG: hypothetical protein V4525_13810 [Pseudomonadota bacterium]
MTATVGLSPLKKTLTAIYHWGLYTFCQAKRSKCFWLGLILIIIIPISGFFIQALAFIEREPIFDAWCMSLWRVASAMGVLIWIHQDIELHAGLDRWRWCQAFEYPHTLRLLGQWLAALILHGVLLFICVFLGLLWSSASPHSWLNWGLLRIIELVLMWGMTQCVYSYWQPSLACTATLIFYTAGRLAPVLTNIMHAGLMLPLPTTSSSLSLGNFFQEHLSAGLVAFISILPPFFVMDVVPDVSALYRMVGYIVLILGYALWRHATHPVRYALE